LPSIGIINCHSGLLPDYRGCSCVEWAIYNDDPVGATCHFVDSGIDTGPTIIKREMEIYEGEHYFGIRNRMIYHQAGVIRDSVKAILEGFRREHAEKHPKGPYYKPMKDQSLIKTVEEKIEDGSYSHLKRKEWCWKTRRFK